MKNRKTNFIMLILSSVLCFTAFNKAVAQASVSIGKQVWTTINLDVVTFRNGDAIPEAKTENEWISAGKRSKPAWCYYNFDSKNGGKNGKLYNWYAVNDKRGLAPIGWHVPSNTEWNTLFNTLGYKVGGMVNNDSVVIKLQDTTSWHPRPYIIRATNTSGFSALPSGLHNTKEFCCLGNHSVWWSSTQMNKTQAWYQGFDIELHFLENYTDFSTGYSVRCVKD